MEVIIDFSTYPQMTLFTDRLRLVATRLACALALFSSSSLIASGTWNSDCGTGNYELVGAGIQNLASYDLFIPEGMHADSIVVEVIGKGAVVPTLCTFSSDTEGPESIAGSALTHIGSVSHLTTVFRKTMAAASTITVSTDDPAHTWSVLAYVFRSDEEGMSSQGEYASYYIYRSNWTASYSLSPAFAPRDVIVKVPITDLDDDHRFAYVEAEAGGIAASRSVSISDMGERLAVVELVLNDVPAHVNEVNVRVLSPNPATTGSHGDSFVFGVGISSRCDGEISLACQSGKSLEIVGAGAHGSASTTLDISDPSSISHIVVEVVTKGVLLPGQCTFSSDVEGPSISSELVSIAPSGAGSEQVGVFRKVMSPASSITISTDDPENTSSVVAYIFRNEDGASSIGSFAHTYLYRANWSQNYPLSVVDGPRHVRITVPMSDIDRVGRYAVISANAGGVSNSMTINTSDMGDFLNIAELVLMNVPGSAEEVQVTISSPTPTSSDPGGDSFVFGVVVSSDCHVSCEAPNIVNYDFVTPISPIVTWEEVPGAIRYEVCGRELDSDMWRCHTRLVNNKRFYGMKAETGYELIVRVQCADGSISPYSEADTIYPMMDRKMENVQPLSVNIYPNPAAEEVFVSLDGSQEKTLVELRDLSGRVMHIQQAGEGQQQIRMNIAQLPAGVYLVHMQDGQNSRTERLLIHR